MTALRILPSNLPPMDEVISACGYTFRLIRPLAEHPDREGLSIWECEVVERPGGIVTPEAFDAMTSRMFTSRIGGRTVTFEKGESMRPRHAIMVRISEFDENDDLVKEGLYSVDHFRIAHAAIHEFENGRGLI